MGRFKIFFTNSLFFLGIVLTFSACSQQSKQQKNYFYYNQPEGLATTDPALAKSLPVMWVSHQLYNTLVELDDSLKIKPSLAKTWQVSADRKTFTFYLRTDVWFHDNEAFPNGKGKKFTAHDVAYSFNRIIDKSTASTGAWIFNNRIDSIEGFKALNDSTFQLKLLRPFNPILGILTMQYASIVAKEVVAKYGKDYRRHPCGTGPFKFKYWDEGQALVLEKNEKYFERDSLGKALPYLNGVHISFGDSRATEFLSFKQGKLDFINDIDPSFKDVVLTKTGKLKKEWQDKIQLNTSPYLNTEYFGFLLDGSKPIVKGSPILNNKIRQAINYGFDRTKMIFYLRNSLGFAASSGMIPKGLPSYNEKLVPGYTYNVEKAKQLLSEAGYPNGKGLSAIKLYTIPIYKDFAAYVAKELANIGIPIQIEEVQKTFLIEKASKNEAPFFRGSWIADYPDAENYLTMFYSKNPSPPNYTRFSNPSFDALYEKALEEPNDSVRFNYYRTLDKMVLENAATVPLWYDMVIHLVQPNIANFKPNALNILELRKAKKINK
jgi:oligopeptide transport system substrate-binding protein